MEFTYNLKLWLKMARESHNVCFERKYKKKIKNFPMKFSSEKNHYIMHGRVFFMNIVCLFELMLYIPVNSNGHVGTSPPFLPNIRMS